MLLACVKGLVAGPVNLGLALLHGAALPAAHALFAAMLTGFGGYGLSLVLFVVALRHLGTARTGAYWHTHRHQHDFSSDGREPHRHPHRHAPITHTHAHYPDIHHRHRH